MLACVALIGGAIALPAILMLLAALQGEIRGMPLNGIDDIYF